MARRSVPLANAALTQHELRVRDARGETCIIRHALSLASWPRGGQRAIFVCMERKRGPGIKIPPPAIFLLAFIIGVWIEIAFARLRIVGGDASARPLRIAGYVLILAGVSVAAWGAFVFRRHQTSVLPFRPATSLVLDGPYRFSRNPMYVGMSLAHVGGGLALNALWPILLLPAALAALFALVIRKEERHLAENFGEEYAEYRGRVRRWL